MLGGVITTSAMCIFGETRYRSPCSRLTDNKYKLPTRPPANQIYPHLCFISAFYINAIFRWRFGFSKVDRTYHLTGSFPNATISDPEKSISKRKLYDAGFYLANRLLRIRGAL